MWRLKVLTIVFAGLMLCSGTFGQAVSGTITGTVNDPKREPLYLPKPILWLFKPLGAVKHIFSREEPSPRPSAPKKAPEP